MKGEDQDGIDANFDVTLLDDFVEVTVDIGAFDHVRCASLRPKTVAGVNS